MPALQTQTGPLTQRLALLESLVAESALNADIADQGMDLARACQPGALVAVDLTDPLLSSEEANGIFQARERATSLHHLMDGSCCSCRTLMLTSRATCSTARISWILPPEPLPEPFPNLVPG